MSDATPFDFFTDDDLVAPSTPAEEVADLVRRHWGLSVTLSALGSQQDQNFLARASGTTEVVGVIKVANPAFSRTELEAQESAIRHLSEVGDALRLPLATVSLEGDRVVAATTRDGPRLIRLHAFLPGGTLSGDAYLAPTVVARLGEVSARVSLGLAEFEHPGLERLLQWDPQFALRATTRLLESLTHLPSGESVERAVSNAWTHLEPLAEHLPRQAVHLDVTDDNVVCAREGARRVPDGVIDFGDLTRSWAVAELAHTLASILHHDGAEPFHVLPAIHAFHARRPLSDAEVDAVWPLVVLRASLLVLGGEHQVLLDGAANAYAAAGRAAEWRIFECATSLPVDVMTALIADTLGVHRARVGVAAARPASPQIVRMESAVRLDVSVISEALDAGAWLEGDARDEEMAHRALDDGAAVAWIERATPRLTQGCPLSSHSSETVPLGVDLWFAETRTLQVDDRFIFDGATLGEGGWIVAKRERLRVRSRGAPSHFVRPEYAPGWLAVTEDPSYLLGLPLPERAERQHLLARRDASFARVQEHYFDCPPRIERGWREHLIDTDARVYLDMVNNVTPLGHGNIEFADALARQLRRLNTNSRFNYEAVVEFSERLVRLVPDPLDTVFLVNSGSEAVDLALRITFAATGRRDVVSLLEAYHGWTVASDAVSTSIQDNPGALASRPDWVHPLDAPHPYRGRHRGDDVALYATQAAQRIRALDRDGRAPAAFIAETFYGNAGGVALPDGYLREVYRAVREVGGLAIADEVQAGYGRLGEWFWGFQHQGVVPDIVTVAKAMGNGYPLGAVITSRAIAEQFSNQGYFFSSTGGSPVSCTAGLAVLNLYERLGLQDNARRVGAHLKSRLEELKFRHPLIGAVHGLGLYLGVEFVRDRKSLEPATDETDAICERLLELGVIMQPTGDYLNVLKIKPPLVVTIESADFFADMLDIVLTQGW